MERFGEHRPALSLLKTLPQNSSLRALTLFMALVLFLFTGCAGGDPSEFDKNASQPDAGLDQEDTDDDTSPGDQDIEDTTNGDDDSSEDPPPVCTPGLKRCVDTNTVETCQPDGQAFATSQCGNGEICDNGNCIVEPVCTPGEKRCADEKNLLVCRPDGGGNITETCPSGTFCIGDKCVSGNPIGESCQSNSDCASGLCRCGSEEDCPAGSRAYCTSDCSQTSCTQGQVCWKATSLDANAYDHCLPSCDGTCSISGLNCTEVETDVNGQSTWRGACMAPGHKPVGSRCESDSECINGECSSEYFGFGVCTHRCETKGCPSNTACANLAGPNEAWCSPKCTGNGTFCPLQTDEHDWSVRCGIRLIVGGGSTDICIK